MPHYLKYILIVCFLEGASVMGVELIGAKLIAPWFGTSLYVWTSVIGISMLGLATGYYLGGRLSRQENIATRLKILLALAAFFIAIMPITSDIIMQMTQMMDVRWGSMISSIVFILPPLVFMGMVSPVVIRYCALEKEKTGHTAGLVFAASTIGGVLSVLLCGFYFLPLWGLYNSAWFFAGLMLSSTVIAHHVNKYRDVIIYEKDAKAAAYYSSSQ
ncbi:hypothetical protein MNBD_GAMMA10-1781 [hydrothermal vent metagenome]|uniref:Spermidine synthase n=1 Tax=hydrothermal vent metagenome TaxID=652676 RepID=A0A3B0XCD5_9ZZZZ